MIVEKYLLSSEQIPGVTVDEGRRGAAPYLSEGQYNSPPGEHNSPSGEYNSPSGEYN